MLFVRLSVSGSTRCPGIPRNSVLIAASILLSTSLPHCAKVKSWKRRGDIDKAYSRAWFCSADGWRENVDIRVFMISWALHLVPTRYNFFNLFRSLIDRVSRVAKPELLRLPRAAHKAKNESIRWRPSTYRRIFWRSRYTSVEVWTPSCI